jgi:hypothetical protein
LILSSSLFGFDRLLDLFFVGSIWCWGSDEFTLLIGKDVGGVSLELLDDAFVADFAELDSSGVSLPPGVDRWVVTVAFGHVGGLPFYW